MKEKKKNYRLRSKVYKLTGTSVVGLSTLGGFVGYQMYTDWIGFRNDMQNFYIVYQDTAKLNLFVALPFLISMMIALFVATKKNKDFFKDKMSLGLLVAIVIFYLVYSVIEVAIFSLIGAFAGSVIDEFAFSPLSNSCDKKYIEQREINIEYDKEKRRILARQQAQEELDGSV